MSSRESKTHLDEMEIDIGSEAQKPYMTSLEVCFFQIINVESFTGTLQDAHTPRMIPQAYQHSGVEG